MARVWELANAWYHDRLAPDFRGRTAAEAEAIFSGLGLTSAFWRRPAAEGEAPSAAAAKRHAKE